MPSSRYPALITVEGVKDLKRRGIGFRIRYELVERAEHGRRPPRYRCIYELEDGRDALLVGSRIPAGGPEERLFLLWPGVFAHHHEFGDGSPLCIYDDFTIVAGPGRPDGDPSGRDDEDRRVDVSRPDKRARKAT